MSNGMPDAMGNSLTPYPFPPVGSHPLVPTETRDLASPDLASTITRQWMTER